MKRFHSILAGLVLAALSTPAWAIQIPVTADTAGTPVKNTIAKAAGKATTLPVSAKSTALLFFDLSNSGITSSAVTGARLIIYLPKVTKPGNLSALFPTVPFQETFTTATIPLPALGGVSSPTAITADNNKGYVVLPGFQFVVESWIDNPSSNTGIALVGDAALNALISSREGAGAGAAAILEIDVNPTGAISPSSVAASGAVTASSGTFGGNVIVNGGGSLSVNNAGLTLTGAAGNISMGGVIDCEGKITSFTSGTAFNAPSGNIVSGAQMRSSTLGVGIAGTNTRGKLEVSGTVNRAATFSSSLVFNNAIPFNNIGGNLASFVGIPLPDAGGVTSIFADGIVAATSFTALSDARIKEIQGRTDNAADLQTLLSIQITDYLYKDKVNRGSRPQKKVIAQEVEKVFPQAVSQHTDVVPDIYARAEIADGWVNLATDLQVGDRVRLIGEKDGEDSIQKVLEVSESGFRTAFQSAGTQVFVYGREVKDFRTVDYEAIAMLNVSATQELAKRLEEKNTELAALRDSNAVLKRQLADVEAREADRVAAEALRKTFDAELWTRLTRLEAAAALDHSAQVTTAALERR